MQDDTSYYKGKSPLVERFIHAFSGIIYAWQKEPNFRIEIIFAILMIAAMIILPMSAVERAILLIIILIVLSSEIVNSVLERLLDVIHPKFSHEVMRIKDTMAAVVLLASAAAIVVGGLILVRPLTAFDAFFQGIISNLRTEKIIIIARAVTHLGGWTILLGAAGVILIFLAYKKRYELLGLVAGSVIFGEIFLFILKMGFQRERPGGTDLIEANGYSFPSGHVFIATVFWLVVGYIITNKNHNKKYLWLVPGIIIPAVALSRVVLSVHWFSDIAGGFLFGIFWLLLWYGINKRILREF